MNKNELIMAQNIMYFEMLNRKELFKIMNTVFDITKKNFEFNNNKYISFCEFVDKNKITERNGYPILFEYSGKCIILPITKNIDVLYDIVNGRMPISIIYDISYAIKLIPIIVNDGMKDTGDYIRYKLIQKIAKETGYKGEIPKHMVDMDVINGFKNSLRIAHNTTPEEYINSNDKLELLYEHILTTNYSYKIDSDEENIYTKICNNSIFEKSDISMKDEPFDENDLRYTLLHRYIYLYNIPLYIKNSKTICVILQEILSSLSLISLLYKKLDNDVTKLNKFYNANKYKINILTDLLVMGYISPYIAKDLEIEDFVKNNKHLNSKIKTLNDMNEILTKIYNKVK